jgi:hypothetical protein
MATVTRARRAQTLLKFALPRGSAGCAAGSGEGVFATSSIHGVERQAVWSNYLRGLLAVREMATFNRT